MITIDCGGMSFLHNYVGICPLDDAPFEVVSCVSLPTLWCILKKIQKHAIFKFVQMIAIYQMYYN